MNTKKFLTWVVVTLLMTLMIGFLFLGVFTGMVSSTLPPIKTFQYKGLPSEFVRDIRAYEISDKYIKIQSIDTLSKDQSIPNYEMIIKFIRKEDGDTLRYHIKSVGDSSSNITTVKLIGAHNLSKKTGGYGLEVKGMDNLLKDFNMILIDSLRIRYRLSIK